jgi:hypothetical protein
MRSPSGARLNQVIFVLVNAWLVVGWAWQLMEEARKQKEERIRALKEEIRRWDEDIERLEGLMEVCVLVGWSRGPWDDGSLVGDWEFC